MDLNIFYNQFLKEKKLSENTVDNKKSETRKTILDLSTTIFFAIAFYMSWICNTNCEPTMDVFIKGVRAFFAGIFGFLYSIIYLLFWSTDCNKCKK